MAVLVHFEAVVKPECLDDLIERLKAGLPDTRAHEGCRDLRTYLNEDGKTLVAIEQWDSKEQYQKYLAWRTETGVMDALGALFDGPPTIRFFEAIDA
ncbi:MAG: antibiotic biosynthesis monooxygenase [Acidobacteriota bacterium]